MAAPSGSKLKELRQAFGSRLAGTPSKPRSQKVDAGAAIRATRRAVSAIQRSEGLTAGQATKRLQKIGRNIRLTRARIHGIASGKSKRLAVGKSVSFDITRQALTRQLSGGLGKGVDPAVIRHVVSSEIAKPETRLNISGSRRATRRRARNLLGIKR